MRITNTMVFNSSLNNIWRNARHLNTLVTQIETTQLIQRPSENPMIANRALRYRTILTETEQFKSNNERGLAWMEVSESAMLNLLVGTPSNRSILQRLHDRLLHASSTGVNYIEDQKGMIEEMRQFLYQMTRIEMNQSYMGRYVFAGFHTDEPPVLHADRPNASYVVQQTFNRHDIETTITFHRPAPYLRPMVFENTHIIKLPFSNVQFPGTGTLPGTANPDDTINPGAPNPGANIAGVPNFGILCPHGTQFEIIHITSDQRAAYTPGASFTVTDPNPPYEETVRHIIHHIVDTGELVLSQEAKDAFVDGTTIVFQTPEDGLKAGELNPRIYFPSWDLTNNNHHFNTANQAIQLEVSPNSFVTINSHARNIITDKFFADMRRLIDFADSLQLTDPLVIREHYSQFHADDDLAQAIERFETYEKSAFADMLHDRINNLLQTIERHISQAQTQHTNLGSRMNRMDMIQIRLEEDEVAYTSLLSDAIDTDIAGTIVRKNGAEAAFQNALFSISRATQLSLADFINR